MNEILSTSQSTIPSDQRLFITQDEKGYNVVYKFDERTQEPENIIVMRDSFTGQVETRATPTELETAIRLAGKMPEEPHLETIRQSGIFGDRDATDKTLQGLAANIEHDKEMNAKISEAAQTVDNRSIASKSQATAPSVQVEK